MPERRVFRIAALSLCAAGLLAACAAPPIPKYAPATSGSTAQLLMRGSVEPGETYGVYLFKEPRACAGLQQVGLGTASTNPPSTTIAAPGLTTTESVVIKPNRTICRVRWSFEPVAGRRYVVTTKSTPTGCVAQVLDATDPNKIVIEPSVRRRDVGGNACLPMEKTTTLADFASRTRASSEADLPIPNAPAAPAAPPARPALPGKTPSVTEDELSGLTGKK